MPPASQPQTGRRLEPEARRTQLLEAAIRIVTDEGLDALSAEAVAQAAAVSKALVFHYFPSNNELLVAVVRAAAKELLASLDVEPAGTPDQRLRAGLEAYISFIEEHPATYLALARGAGTDPALLEVFEETRARIVALIGSAMVASELPPRLRIAVRGWIALVEEAVLHWLDDGEPISRAELVTLLHDAALHLFAERPGRSVGAGPSVMRRGPDQP